VLNVPERPAVERVIAGAIRGGNDSLQEVIGYGFGDARQAQGVSAPSVCPYPLCPSRQKTNRIDCGHCCLSAVAIESLIARKNE